MKRDILNFSKGHASVIKKTLLAILLTCGVNVVASDAKTPIVRLQKMAKSNACESTQLNIFSARIDTLFKDFFDVNNLENFTTHKKNFLSTLADLNNFSNNANLNKANRKEILSLLKELNAFIATLDSKAQPILNKGKKVTYADIMPLAIYLKPFAHLIPDAYFKSIPSFLNAIQHRLSC